MKRYLQDFQTFNLSEGLLMSGAPGGKASNEYKKAVNDRVLQLLLRSDLGEWKIDDWWYGSHGGAFTFTNPKFGDVANIVLSVTPFWGGNNDLLVSLNVGGTEINDEINSVDGIDKQLTGNLQGDAKWVRDLVMQTLERVASDKNMIRLMDELSPNGAIEWATSEENEGYGGEDVLKFMLRMGYKPKKRSELQRILDILGDDYMEFLK